MVQPDSNGKSEVPAEVPAEVAASAPANPVPVWVNAELLESVLKDTVKDYKSTKNFKAYPGMSAGENYATIMLRIEVDVELLDGGEKALSFMMKVPHDNPMFVEMSKLYNMFTIENQIYREVVPEFEKIYRDAGVEIKFGANYHKLNCDKDNVLLEDLRPRGFKNANRLEGLDMEHTKCALRKLAQWHAASAVRVATVGKYPEHFSCGFYNEKQRDTVKLMIDSLTMPFMQCVPLYEGHESYQEALDALYPKLTDEVFRANKVDPNEFNVLNHGDCWSNNIMFQYDAFGKIKETYFVDFQLPKYGTPAQDLYYFLISSTKFELKLKQFEYFIKFYHDCLVEYLTLLKYPKKLPTLKEIHIALYKHGLWGLMTAYGVMCGVLLDPTEAASVTTLFSESEAGMNLKKLLFSNARYRKHIEAILPWLHNRGALE